MRLLQLWAAELAFCCLLTAIVPVLASAATVTPEPTPVCQGPCDGQFCEIPGTRLGGQCLVGPGDTCVCVSEITPTLMPPPTATPTPTAVCQGPCDGQSCTVPGTGLGGNCLSGLDDTCRCVPEVTPTATVVGVSGCVGDCDGDGQVTIQELILAVEISLGESAEVTRCSAADENDDLQVTVDELVRAVDNALDGCPMTCVPFPPLAPTFAFTVSPGAPQAGDHVDVSIHISGGAPHGVYRLVPTGDVVDVTGPTYEDSEGSEVQFGLDALRPGTTDLTLMVFYTIDLPSSDYCADSRYQTVESEPIALTVAARADAGPGNRRLAQVPSEGWGPDVIRRPGSSPRRIEELPGGS